MFTLIPSSFFSKYCVKLYGWMCITFQMPLVFYMDNSDLVGCIEDLRRFSVFQQYRDLEAGDNQSLKIQVARPESHPGPLAPQAKSSTTSPPLRLTRFWIFIKWYRYFRYRTYSYKCFILRGKSPLGSWSIRGSPDWTTRNPSFPDVVWHSAAWPWTIQIMTLILNLTFFSNSKGCP